MSSVNEARKCIKLPPLLIPCKEQSSSIASINNMSTSSSMLYSLTPAQLMMPPPPLPIAAMMGMSAYPVALVCPPNKSSILGGGNSDLSHDSNHSVSTCIPFFLPHLVWKCMIESHDASCISRVPVTTLIDHGSGPVLINQELVCRLQLPVWILHELFPISGAFFNVSNPSPQILLSHWVKLKLHDPNNWYSACTVCALVASSLCHPIILGLPFLHHNNITVNIREGMTVNFDLLHPVAPPVHKPIQKLWDVIADNVANRKLLLNELNEMCTWWRPIVDASCKPVNGINIVTAIRGRIELAAVEHLEKLNLEIHEIYADVFKPIPHVNEMPDMVQCKIKLKDVSKTITTRTYSCPRKFCEAWGILI